MDKDVVIRELSLALVAIAACHLKIMEHAVVPASMSNEVDNMKRACENAIDNLIGEAK